MGVCYLITYKVDGNAWKLKTHVTGALLNRHTKAAAFIDCCEWPHDSNLTINIILHILLWVQTTVMKNVFLVLNEWETVQRAFFSNGCTQDVGNAQKKRKACSTVAS